MESDSESEMLRTRFEALKVPTKLPADGSVKPQHSPTAARYDRAALDADLRRRLQALSDTGTDVDEEELEKMLQSEDEYLEELFPRDTHGNAVVEVRNLYAQIHGSRPGSRQSRPPLRQDSTKTITSVANRYSSADSDADDEGADDILARTRDELGLDGHSRSTSSNSSRDEPVGAARYAGDAMGDEEGEDTDSSQSIKGATRTPDKGNEGGQRTPPSHSTRLFAEGDVNRYRVLFQDLETPRALPVLTPTSESEPLPPAFVKLQGMSPQTGKIGRNRDSNRRPAPGPAPRLDLEGWRTTKDDKPEIWCIICNADAILKCSGCDNDLYCKKCFAEGHPKDAFDAGEHKPEDIDEAQTPSR